MGLLCSPHARHIKIYQAFIAGPVPGRAAHALHSACGKILGGSESRCHPVRLLQGAGLDLRGIELAVVNPDSRTLDCRSATGEKRKRPSWRCWPCQKAPPRGKACGKIFWNTANATPTLWSFWRVFSRGNNFEKSRIALLYP